MADADAGIAGEAALARTGALLAGTVREAGALALSLFRTELKNWTKGASSPVSEADIAVNDLLEKRLREATPAYGWLSEESADNPAPSFPTTIPKRGGGSSPSIGSPEASAAQMEMGRSRRNESSSSQVVTRQE